MAACLYQSVVLLYYKTLQRYLDRQREMPFWNITKVTGLRIPGLVALIPASTPQAPGPNSVLPCVSQSAEFSGRGLK